MQESRRERKKRETRTRIVMAAIRLFEEQGYEQTTVAQIAAAADVDPKTFFNYFGSKDEVLFVDAERDLDVMFEAIARRRPEEGPGEVLARTVQEYAAHRRPKVPRREPEELSAATRLVLTTPALQAKGLYLLLGLQQRIADELLKAFPGQLDPVTAAAMTGALLGAIQQAGLASVRLGQSQDELWAASRHGAEIAMRGLLAVRPATGGPATEGP
ncbi:TetR/AcrR family transcriptional regulator [Marinitenerispora sediminis]|uniref:TetR family transcriptional regulator n=1 Tax=Marinitenerispora sediminis TaxID=1931232 RepID=A0A368T7C3_9ACTN|nr:TetR/AcrR family transcriptional regulator [Marinitenerispora sediminis]RCV50905.1 TetR family transcriptional regulator [Marinitenerispora sediminis]RCV59735.1 TetR family transcriptional regulator [Marinitenerispora sediminis]RCV59813.1 TetR family transcriptional regulator [Marinitenerispora sediminis]